MVYNTYYIIKRDSIKCTHRAKCAAQLSYEHNKYLYNDYYFIVVDVILYSYINKFLYNIYGVNNEMHVI